MYFDDDVALRGVAIADLTPPQRRHLADLARKGDVIVECLRAHDNGVRGVVGLGSLVAQLRAVNTGIDAIIPPDDEEFELRAESEARAHLRAKSAAAALEAHRVLAWSRRMFPEIAA